MSGEDKRDLATLVDELGEQLEFSVTLSEEAKEPVVEDILRRLLDGERIDHAELNAAGITLAEREEEPDDDEGGGEEAPLDDRPGAEPGEEEPSDEEIEDFEPEPPFVAEELFQFGPLAAGITIMEAMLAEAKAGYVSNRIAELEQAIRTEFSEEVKIQIAAYASQVRDPLGLPDVGGAYQQIVAAQGAEG